MVVGFGINEMVHMGFLYVGPRLLSPLEQLERKLLIFVDLHEKLVRCMSTVELEQVIIYLFLLMSPD